MAAALVDPQAREQTVRVLIVEDHTLLADGLAVSLRQEGIAAEVATGSTGESIIDAARAFRPDIVLLDLVMGDEIGLSVPLIPELRATGALVLMLTGVTDPALLGACLEAGAVGLVSKSEGFDSVFDTLMRAAHRQTTRRTIHTDLTRS